MYAARLAGLVLMGARYYAPCIGRFLSRDPSGFSSGPNLYAYCLDDPIDFFDPDGCEPEPAEGTLARLHAFWMGGLGGLSQGADTWLTGGSAG